ncbi:hypothetical protein [Patulibacter minatonensis]|uniref:hypothetical protein n=1 Tax=Patulibacter minatonensis TaxID=298163 RepID=UPI0004B27683|nr:hypothetical protein [Patulibacter minatonensis]
MTSPLDLTGDIASAIDGAVLDGKTLVVGYVKADGSPSLSFRGSTLVLGPQQLGFWSRTTDSGLPVEVADRPKVSLLYYGGGSRPGPLFLSIKGTAKADPSANDAVWDGMVQAERDYDPERKGVAIVVEVEQVDGAGADGFFSLTR